MNHLNENSTYTDILETGVRDYLIYQFCNSHQIFFKLSNPYLLHQFYDITFITNVSTRKHLMKELSHIFETTN